MMRLLTSIVGAFGEAWSEVRHHRLRVLLSLIGIAVSVGALSAVVALADFQRQYTAEQSDRMSGRAATIQISAYSETGAEIDADALDEQFARVAPRYGFSHVTRIVQYFSIPLQAPDGIRQVSARLIDPAFPEMRRADLLSGRWFTAEDAELLAPAVVVSEPLWESLGAVPIAQHPTLTLTGTLAGTYQIIGVTPKQSRWDEERRVDLLYDDFRARVDAMPADAQLTREVWVPPGAVDELGPVLAMDLRAVADPGVELSVSRTDWAAQSWASDSAAVFEMVTGAIATLVLALGGLSLLNIQLVAMRQRIREIGVRRSFGATAGRVFFSVLLESVVATVVAGIVGIMLAVALLRSPLVLEMFQGMQDVPAFPIRAAVAGLVASVAIGALAGLLPALVAVRVKVIETLRY